MSKHKVTEIVKNYVSRCGGSVPLEYLLQDYKIAYKSDLPYGEFGYPTVNDFLDTMSEISLFEEEGVTYVESFEFNLLRKKELPDSQLDHLDDLSQLSIQMKNNLLLECREGPRVVKIQPSSNVNTNYKKYLGLNRNNSSLSNRSEETVGDKSFSSGSAHSLNTTGLLGSECTLDVDSVSAYDYPCENYSSALSDYQTEYNYSFEEPCGYQSISTSSPVMDPYQHILATNGVNETENLVPPHPDDGYQSIPILNDENNPRKELNETVDPLELLAMAGARETKNIYQSPPLSNGFSKSPESYLLDDNRQNLHTPETYRSSFNGKMPELPESYYFQEKPQNTQTRGEYKLPPTPGNTPELPDCYFFDRKLQSQDTQFLNMYQSPTFTNNVPKPPDTYPVHMKPHDTFGLNNAGDWIPETAYKPTLPNNWPTRITDGEIVSRIVKLVNSQSQTGGIDSLTVELKYMEMHSTSLPKHWLNLVEESFMLYVEKLSSCTLVYPNRWYPIAPTSSSLPLMRYPDIKTYWNIYVTVYENTTCVWFRLMDEDLDLKYNVLRQEMSRYYKRVLGSMQNVTDLTNGQLCAIHFKNEWCRGEVLEYDSQTTCARCLLIDDGIIHNCFLSKIYELDEKFTNTPALAVQGGLNGLEKWENCNYINCKLRKLLCDDRKVKIKIDKFLDSHRVLMQVFVEQNSQLVHLNFKMLELARCELGLPVLYADQMYDVIVLSVIENHSAQVQLLSPSLTLLEKTLQKVVDLMKDDKNLEQARISNMFDLKLDKIYLARCENGQWRRIVCRQFHLSNRVSALFIDYAEVKTVYLHDVFDTSIFPDTVSFIQPQAVLIKLLDIDAIVLQCLRNAHTEKHFSIKILRSESPALVQFFAKLPGGNVTPIINVLSSNSGDFSNTS